MAFIRTKKVGDKEYRQLVENYRDDGRHRQRVLAHLGKHETLEEAIEAARVKVEAAKSEKFWEARGQAWNYEETIQQRYGPLLERYHGGKIPETTEVSERARLSEVEVPEEVEEYRRAFGDVREVEHVTVYGTHVVHAGLERFRDYLYWYGRWRETVQRLEHTLHRHEERLKKLEAALDDERKRRPSSGD